MYSALYFDVQRTRAEEAALLGNPRLSFVRWQRRLSARPQQLIASDSDISRESRELCVYGRMSLVCRVNSLASFRPHDIRFGTSDGTNDRSSFVQRQPNPDSTARAILRPSSSLLGSTKNASIAIAVGEKLGVRDSGYANLEHLGIAV